MKTITNWEDTYKYWLSLNVPDIEFISFDIEKHSPHFEWFNYLKQEQLRYTENPIKQTAFHLGKYLKDRDKELIAAYKIFSILRYSGNYEYNSFIKACFSKHDEDLLGWWSPNSKYLFPYFEGVNDFSFNWSRYQGIDWKTIVTVAANFWTQIAKSISIIIVPELMGHESTEYKAYNDVAKSIEEKREYNQYLRLKEKFEK